MKVIGGVQFGVLVIFFKLQSLEDGRNKTISKITNLSKNII
jgi:hypothetical protein